MIIFYSVCFNVHIRIGIHKTRFKYKLSGNWNDVYYENNFTRNWEIEHCQGPDTIAYEKSSQESETKEELYVHRCCLVPGIYNLICRNNQNLFGWGNASVEIFGQRFCDDFLGNKVVRKVVVKCKFWLNTSCFILIDDKILYLLQFINKM